MGAPVRYTCPDIDKVIGSIRRAVKSAEYGQKTIEQNAGGDEFTEIVNELWSVEGSLEDLRDSNSSLRKWGDELETEMADSLEAKDVEIADLEEKVSDLERRLEKYELLEKDPNQQELNSLW